MKPHASVTDRQAGRYLPPLSPFTLTFHSSELRKEYQDFSTERSLTYVRLALVLAIVLYIAFHWLDPLIVPEATNEILVIRILSILMIGAGLYLTYTKWGVTHLQFVNSILVVLSGLGLMGMVFLSDSAGNFYYEGLILATMYAHGLLRLRFIYATVATWSVILMYAGAALLIGESPGEILVNNLFYLVSANIMGMFASYWLEYYMKAAYWQTRRLKQKSLELAKEHARKSSELDLARQLQLNLLPNSSPRLPDYEFSFSMSTATEIGGDFYDYHIDDDEVLTFAIGDATGHGAQAGFMVTAIKMLFNELAGRIELLDFLRRASRSIHQLGFRKLYMAFAIGTLKNNEIEIAGAGIPSALVYRADTGAIEKVTLKGLPLGGPVEFPYRKYRFMLNPGDSVLLMTDGLPELFNRAGEMFGYGKTETFFSEIADRSSDEIIMKLNQKAAEWLDGALQNDDTTFLVIRRKQEVPVGTGKKRVFQPSLN